MGDETDGPAMTVPPVGMRWSLRPGQGLRAAGPATPAMCPRTPLGRTSLVEELPLHAEVAASLCSVDVRGVTEGVAIDAELSEAGVGLEVRLSSHDSSFGVRLRRWSTGRVRWTVPWPAELTGPWSALVVPLGVRLLAAGQLRRRPVHEVWTVQLDGVAVPSGERAGVRLGPGARHRVALADEHGTLTLSRELDLTGLEVVVSMPEEAEARGLSFPGPEPAR